MANVLRLKVEIKYSANKLYGFFKNNLTQLKNHLPGTFKSIHVIEGDGPSGDVMNLYRSFQIKLVSVTPTGEGSCLMKWFENTLPIALLFGDSPIPAAFINLLQMVSIELPSQLLKQG
ncbi:hypothetical protein MKX01_041680 [Papaver californicum]|nr:hypothetical protein MKX01_041680 [Papaver californicum]